ncbi:MAG: glycosyltransferase [Promethearchaeota archaeon]
MQEVHIGNVPPPFGGGISVYLYRLSKINSKAEFIHYNKINNFWFIKQLFCKTRKNFISHNSNLKFKIKLYFLSLISHHRYSCVIHGRILIEKYYNGNHLTRFLIKQLFKRSYFIQVVNKKYEILFKHILNLKNVNIFVKNAFLPPPTNEEKLIIKTYSQKVKDFLYKKSPVLVGNASSLSFYKGDDLYGLDLLIKLIKLLKKNYPNIGLVFGISSLSVNKHYFNKIKGLIKELNIKDNIIFITGNKRIWPIFKRADLMIRPTNYDGDSVSIREALFFNIPVIASDVIKRPEKCFLFKNRDIKDLYNKTLKILNERF